MASLGIAGLLFVIGSVGSPHYGRARWVFAVMLLSTLSYYVTFIAVAGYVYDRFLLPVTCILALCAAIGLRRWLDGTAGVRIAGLVLLAWLVARGASVDLLLLRDSRLVAEEWLEGQVRRDQTVAAVNQYGYLPRIRQFRWTWIAPSIPATRAARPDFIVINREYVERLLGGTEERQWIEWLESGAAPYEEAFRVQGHARVVSAGVGRSFHRSRPRLAHESGQGQSGDRDLPESGPGIDLALRRPREGATGDGSRQAS